MKNTFVQRKVSQDLDLQATVDWVYAGREALGIKKD
jgi:hypothetical protein